MLIYLSPNLIPDSGCRREDRRIFSCIADGAWAYLRGMSNGFGFHPASSIVNSPSIELLFQLFPFELWRHALRMTMGPGNATQR